MMNTQLAQSKTALAVPEQKITALDELVQRGLIAQNQVSMFERTFAVATCVSELQKILTPEIMEPIMKLQGTPLGFRTDKDKTGGYPVDVVRDCLIEAVMSGVRPVGNEFNIIADRCYLTKEGLGYKLRNIEGLSYCMTPGIPKMVGEKGSVVAVTIEWKYKGESEKRVIEFAIRVNFGMGADAIIGKATRKARAWLYAYITGIEFGDGDVSDGDAIPVNPVKPASIFSEQSKTAETVETKGTAEVPSDVADTLSLQDGKPF